MNEKNHTVTIPYEDYLQMKDVLDKSESIKKSIAAHFMQMEKEGVVIDTQSLRLGELPKEVQVIASPIPTMSYKSSVTVYFKY